MPFAKGGLLIIHLHTIHTYLYTILGLLMAKLAGAAPPTNLYNAGKYRKIQKEIKTQNT